MRWPRNLPERREGVWTNLPEVSIEWTGGPRYDHLIRFSDDLMGDFGTASSTLRLRLAGHVIIDQMPDEGVQETLESLLSLYQFYLNRLQYERPSLQPEFERPSPPSRLTARVRPVTARPEFEVEVEGE